MSHVDHATVVDDVKLAAHLARAGISPAGTTYLNMATDCFHDNSLIPGRAPSACPARTLLYDKRVVVEIGRPAAISPGETWDAHIALMPLLSAGTLAPISATMQTDPYTAQNGYVGTGAETGWNNGSALIVVCKVESGVSTFSLPAVQEWQTIGVSELAQSNKRARIIGGAYEVHNTTSKLNQQGQVVDYRVENNPEPMSCVWPLAKAVTIGGVDQTLVSPEHINTTVAKLPPTNVGLALQSDGVTRAAAQGCLVPFVFDNLDFELRPATCGPALLMGEANGSGVATGISLWQPTGITNYTSQMTNYREVPFRQCGSYFTGLSYETTLSLTLRLQFEVAPGPASTDMAMANMSPPFEDRVIQALANAQAHLAAGYPVGDNASGDFRRTMFRLIKNALPVLGAAFKGMSSLGGVAGAVGQAGSAAIAVEKVIEGAVRARAEARRRARVPAAPKPGVRRPGVTPASIAAARRRLRPSRR